MIRHNYTLVRSTALSIATAIAVSIPAINMNSQSNQTQVSRKTSYKATSGTRKYQASYDITSIIKSLNLDKELRNGTLMMPRPSHGAHYGAESLNFRTELKGVMSDFLAVICIVPALSTDYTLINNLEAALTLVDYIPARSLFLMWKTLGDQLERIRTGVNHFGQDLAVVPPLEDFTFFNETTNSYEASETRCGKKAIHHDETITRSLFNRSFVDLLQARIEMYAFRLDSFADLILNSTKDTGPNEVPATLISNDRLKAPLELIAMTR